MATTKRPPPTSELDSGGWTFRARGFAHGPFEPLISGCLTGDLGVPEYEPDVISWLAHPAISAHRATASRRSADEFRADRRIGRDLRVELPNQVLEHLSHRHRPPNSSSLRFRDSASSRRAVSHEVRVCGGRVPFFLIHFSRNVIVSGSDE